MWPIKQMIYAMIGPLGLEKKFILHVYRIINHLNKIKVICQ